MRTSRTKWMALALAMSLAMPTLPEAAKPARRTRPVNRTWHPVPTKTPLNSKQRLRRPQQRRRAQWK
ncbi:hypothetical protein D3C73_644970 [compost metagenome]